MPNVPNDVWNTMRKEINASDMIKLIVPIYAKHYTNNDIKELIAFYRTPIGKKVIEKQSIIMQESMAAGLVYGKEINKKIKNRLRMNGYQPPAGI